MPHQAASADRGESLPAGGGAIAAQEGDHEFESEGVKVVVDPFSAPYLSGARVDYLETIQESGFKIDNPNAVASCGCGHSFTVADDADPGDAPAASGCGSGCSH